MSVFYFSVFIVMVGGFYHYLPRLFSLLLVALGFRSMYLSFYGLPKEIKAMLSPESLSVLERILDIGWMFIILGVVMLIYKLIIIKTKINQVATEEA